MSISQSIASLDAGVDYDIEPYVELKRRVAADGLLVKSPLLYLYPGVVLIAIAAAVALGLIFVGSSWWALFLAAPAAFLFGQLGFLAHDATHNQVLRTSRQNYMLSLFLFNFILGGSRGWWADKHNAHHASPNLVGTDPDIEGGVIALTEREIEISHGVSRMVMKHQATAIAPILSLSAVQILIYSVGHLFSKSLRNAALEAFLLVAHWCLYLGVLVLILGPGIGFTFAAAQLGLLGMYLGGAFLPNHVGMPTRGPDEDLDFLHRQVSTARNLRAGWMTDYIFGGLSCQIEHHLFPSMPRYRLRKAAVHVRALCVELEIPYKETSVWGAYREIHHHLLSLALLLRQPRVAIEVL